ncbi:TVP38/TMEM64 family inner membrane protein YdjZ [Acaryochloris thomasi RCC1774]|uniref:TVP38/TMEM64 family membrane protein n=1 Tax=Acaryochloris thomasi RCC1774 TaxID=1764569 RepID=A0A2W1JXB3_9CYAN|nr:TVP38/TMEM64 family protein [Acaryochloris thomasi]PZD74722.1 TVP38/TMEM64 family inner membrane protein YdjZ [Acaryochloris thomasi RCC1774]
MSTHPQHSETTITATVTAWSENRDSSTWQQVLPWVGLFMGGLGLYWGWQSDLEILTPNGLQQAVAQSGAWGPVLYVGVLAISVVVSQIPGVPLALAAGAIWGPLLAGVYSVLGAFLGGLVAYGLGHSLGRTAIKKLTGKSISFSTERGELYIGGLIFLTRLLPIFSFDLISYGAGVSGLSLPIYASATLFGMIPSTFLLTYMGATLTIGPELGVGLAVLFTVAFVSIPWLMHRHNWLNVRELVCVES